MVYSDTDRQSVQQLIVSEKVSGTVEEWLPGYQMELAEVKRRRLEPVSPEHMADAVRSAVRLRMRLEPKKDGRKKGRLILQGFREPVSWDTTSTDSPTASLSTIRTLLFMAGMYLQHSYKQMNTLMACSLGMCLISLTSMHL